MERTLWDLLCKAAHDEPVRIALSEAATGRAISWAALADLADRVSAGLVHLGMRPGDRVVLALPNRIEFVAAYFGILRAGLIAVPVSPRATTGEFLRVMGDSAARVVIVDVVGIASARAAVEGMRSVLTSAEAGPPAVELIVVETAVEPRERTWNAVVGGALTDPAARADDIPSSDPEALALLLYTSGTSGRPRGAMLTQRALIANIEQVGLVDPPMLLGRDVVLALVPLFHIYGLNAVLGQAVAKHARVVLVDGFDPEGSLDLIEDEAVSVVPAAPPVFAHWMQIDDLADRLGAVRFTLSGSAPISPDLVEAFVARTSIPLHQGYGMSETAPVLTSTMASAFGAHGAMGGRPNGSVGAPLPGIDLRIAPSARLDRAEPEGSGEIQVRGRNLFSGYWPDGHGGPDADGWYATGDVGYIDDAGDLHLVDRLKELIIVSGFNVFPTEVEEVIADVPDVTAVAVVGLPDPVTGEAVAAWVTPAAHTDHHRLAEDVVATCRRRLAGYKVPVVVHVVERLPYSSTGKVQRGRLRALERQRTVGVLE
ncbi:MAG: long-chain fatty acid--CoA ligase [Marmoricola sp.]